MDENVLSSEIASDSGVGMLNQRMESTVEGSTCQVFLKQALK